MGQRCDRSPPLPQVRCPGYSLGLERVLTDFGATVAFGEVPLKVREHYGIEVSVSAVRKLSERHGLALQNDLSVAPTRPSRGVHQALAEMDGSIIPIVQIAGGVGDERRRRPPGLLAGSAALVSGRSREPEALLWSAVGQCRASWQRVESGGGARWRRSRNTRALCVGWRGLDHQSSASTVRFTGHLCGGLLSRLRILGSGLQSSGEGCRAELVAPVTCSPI